MSLFKTIPFLFVFLSALCVSAQKVERYNSFSYNVNEGLLQSNVLDMAFDQNNSCWLSFANGIQKFDGKAFVTISIQAGLPDDKWVKFFQSKSGVIFFSNSGGISRYNIKTNRFQIVYSDERASMPAQFIGEDENSIYFITGNGMIAGMDNRSFQMTSSASLELPLNTINSDNVKISDNIIHHSVSILINSTLYLWNLKQKKLLYKSAPIADISPFFLRMAADDKVLFYNAQTDPRLQLYDYTNASTRLILQKQKSSTQPFRCVIFPWKNTLLFSLYNRLFQTGTGLEDIQNELVNFQNKPLAGNSSIAHIKEDHFGNLYLVTINEGFTKVIRNNFPIKYYGTTVKENNYVISIFADKKRNKILSGTHGNGLLVFDTLQRVVKHFKTLPGKRIGFSVNTIIKNKKGEYILFVWGEKTAWKVAADLSKLSAVKILSAMPQPVTGISYFGNPIFQNDREAVTLSQNMFYRINFPATTITEHTFLTQNPMSGILYRDLILTHENDALLFFDTATLAERKKIAFKNTGGVRSFAVDKNYTIYLGTNKGIFNIDSTGKILFHLNKQFRLPDECIYAMALDSQQNLWCSTTKGIFRLNKDKSIYHLKKEDGLQENEFNTNTVAAAEDGELFFGGVNGISSFFPEAIHNTNEQIRLLFTSIKINNKDAFADKAVWNVNQIKVPYNESTFSFDFIAMANSNPGQYIHQYRMKGIDEDWIQNTELQTVRYFLPPGKYVLQVFASRFFNKDAQPMKEINIVVRPPFWKTWWFITGIAVLLLSSMAVIINQNNRKVYAKKLLTLEAERRIQLERERISRELHDDLGTRVNMLAYNTSLLDEHNSATEIKTIKERIQETSGEMLQSLRETVWTLKQEEINATDVWTRFKNFIAKMQRTYSQIQFKIEEEEVPEMKMNYNEALNTIRILQEAVNNAVKHSSCTIIQCKKRYNGKNVVFIVADNGTGMDPLVTATGTGNGIENMRHRANESSFELKIISTTGQGCLVTLSI